MIETHSVNFGFFLYFAPSLPPVFLTGPVRRCFDSQAVALGVALTPGVDWRAFFRLTVEASGGVLLGVLVPDLTSVFTPVDSRTEGFERARE